MEGDIIYVLARSEREQAANGARFAQISKRCGVDGGLVGSDES